MDIMKRTGEMGTEQQQHDKQPAEDEVQSFTDPVTEPATPLRQLLHWATGDRDAEAQALADETLARLDPKHQDEQTTTEEPNVAVLAAAKNAVSTAHGDSLNPATLNEAATLKDADMAREAEIVNKPGANLLKEWEDAASFAAKAEPDSAVPPSVVTDVARPPDVEAIIDASTNS
jgi:hypothetical protein